MITKIQTALVAALVIGSASTAFAAEVTANADRDRGFQSYQQTAVAPQPRGELIARAQLIEGRNVGVEVQYPVPSDQKHWIERSPIDFNS